MKNGIEGGSGKMKKNRVVIDSAYVVWNMETGDEKIIIASNLGLALSLAVGNSDSTIHKYENIWTLDDWCVTVTEDDQMLRFDVPRQWRK